MVTVGLDNEAGTGSGVDDDVPVTMAKAAEEAGPGVRGRRSR